MSILSRCAEILSSNINAMLDKCENPEKMIDQYLREAIESLGQVKDETAGVMADERQCKRVLDDVKSEVDRQDALARKALLAGNEDDAKVFLAKKQSLMPTLENAQRAYDAAVQKSASMKQMHDKLVNDINDLKARKNSVKATMAAARAQDRVNDAKAAMDGASGAMAGFARMEEKAQRMLDASMARAELDAAPADPTEGLAAKYEGGGEVAVDEALAKMKAELGVS